LTPEITSTNPVVQAIISGSAPQPARLAAARGMLPLPQNDLLEVLVALTTSDDAQIAAAATETLKAESSEDLLIAASAQDTAPAVLAYLATQPDAKSEVYEATILNTRTPDQALAKLAATTAHSALLELMNTVPKTRRWNARARVGTRKKWYRLPEEVAHGSTAGGG